MLHPRTFAILLSVGVSVALALAVPSGAAPVSGRVFLDDNANGRLDPGEKALHGVAVSDGVAWAITDANGRYAIEPRLPVLVPAGTDPILTVSFPSGTWPVGAWYRRAGAKAADGVDFPLRKDAQKLPFTFVHATDPHVPRGGLALFRGFRAEMEALAPRPPFCILTGDCANVPNVRPPEAARSEFTLFAQQARGFPFPLICIPGNHDAAGLECLVGWDRKSRDYGYGLYWAMVGPTRWSFDYAGVHFVGLDWLRKGPAGWTWGVCDEAVQWLAEDLRHVPKGTRILLFVHFPQGPEEFDQLLRSHAVTQIFGGHVHVVSSGTYAGVPYVLSGSLGQMLPGCGQKLGYRFVRVDADRIETFYKPLDQAAGVALDFPAPGAVVRWGEPVRGRICDPQGRIKTVTVEFGNRPAEATVHEGPILRFFDARPDLAKIQPGLHKLAVSISDGKTTWRDERYCFVGWPKSPTTATAPASAPATAPQSP